MEMEFLSTHSWPLLLNRPPFPIHMSSVAHQPISPRAFSFMTFLPSLLSSLFLLPPPKPFRFPDYNYNYYTKNLLQLLLVTSFPNPFPLPPPPLNPASLLLIQLSIVQTQRIVQTPCHHPSIILMFNSDHDCLLKEWPMALHHQLSLQSSPSWPYLLSLISGFSPTSTSSHFVPNTQIYSYFWISSCPSPPESPLDFLPLPGMSQLWSSKT